MTYMIVRLGHAPADPSRFTDVRLSDLLKDTTRSFEGQKRLTAPAWLIEQTVIWQPVWVSKNTREVRRPPDQKTSTVLQALQNNGSRAFHAGYPQAVPQGLGVSDPQLHDRLMSLIKKQAIASGPRGTKAVEAFSQVIHKRFHSGCG